MKNKLVIVWKTDKTETFKCNTINDAWRTLGKRNKCNIKFALWYNSVGKPHNVIKPKSIIPYVKKKGFFANLKSLF